MLFKVTTNSLHKKCNQVCCYWAYLGPNGVIPGAVAKFLGALEASKKDPYFKFWLVRYIGNFKTLYLAKVLFLL